VIIQGTLTEGEDLVQLTSFTNLFGSSAFDIANIIFFFTKTSSLNEEVNRTSPSPSVGIPWFFQMKTFQYSAKQGKAPIHNLQMGSIS
jgi:hypothetical protein